MKPYYKARNRNDRPFDGPRSTARWFDERREDRRAPSHPCGFVNEGWGGTR